MTEPPNPDAAASVDVEKLLTYDEAGEVLVCDDGALHLLIRGEAAWERVAALLPPTPPPTQFPAQLAEQGGAELLARLEAASPRLLRFERAFLDDFRRRVRSGLVPPALLAKAAEILSKRE